MNCTPRQERGFSLLKLAGILAVGLLCWSLSFAQATNPSAPGKSSAQEKTDKNPSEPPTTKLRIQVAGGDGKPVGNASVYVRFNVPGGLFHHDKLAELSFKTNEDGSVKVPEIPQGKIMIQVVATGWHTYGRWYDIEKDEETVQIKLDPPPHWY
jgi:hypothetical protein